MGITLCSVAMDESIILHEMQKLAFRALLDKYRDDATSPGAEPLQRIQQLLANDTVDHYWIQLDSTNIGYIRIQQKENRVCRLSRMFLLPAFQGHGYAQDAIRQAEAKYPLAQKWELDTIKQEAKLCHLYEKMGYRLSGGTYQIQPGMDLVDYTKLLKTDVEPIA